MISSGKLGDGVLPGVLHGIHSDRKSGFLRLERKDESCGLHFVNGHIICGEAGPLELRVGEVLVATGLLEREALVQALEARERTVKRLGEILAEQGVLGEDEIEYALAFQVRAILARVLSWKAGTYALEEASGHDDVEDHPRRSSTGEMLLEAVRLVRDPEAVAYALGDLDRVLLPATDPLVRFQRLTLLPTEGFVLSRVDGTCTAREVVQVTPLPAAEVERSLLGLICTGMLEFASSVPQETVPDTVTALRQEVLDAYESRHRRTDAEVLGVSAHAPQTEIRAAYLRLAKRYHPDAHHHPALADLEEKLGSIFARLNAAFDALSRIEPRVEALGRVNLVRSAPAAPEHPPELPPPPSPPDAEERFRKAEERFGDGRYWEAVALLEEAIPYMQGVLRARARLLLARIYLKYADRTKHAEKELQSVIQEAPDNVEAHVLLGGLYKQGGLAARAGAMFRRALELNPRHKVARAELEALSSEPPPEAGMLGKLFRKR